MAKYTTEVKTICEEIYKWDNHENMADDPTYSDVDNIINYARAKIFDFDFPIFDENYRATLETKIIKHYYFKEIGVETTAHWKFCLGRRLNEIMPYYNQLYQSALLKFNPFYNVERAVNKDKVDTKDTVNVGTSDSTAFSEVGSHGVSNMEETGSNKEKTTFEDEVNATSKTETEDWKAYSDTPQGGLDGIANNTYLTNAEHDWGESTTTGKTTDENEKNVSGSYDRDVITTTNNQGQEKRQNSSEVSNNEIFTGTGKYLEYVLGKEGTETYSEMLEKYRKTFLNIDMMVIEKLGDLFMSIW